MPTARCWSCRSKAALVLDTELGRLELEPQEIAVIPRGLRFRVELPNGSARGYICENFGAPFRLPDLGPIGSNGLANARDFLTPRARYEDIEAGCELMAKFGGHLWAANMDHSPLDVVAWHGNNAPYKYDLRRFNTMGSTSATIIPIRRFSSCCIRRAIRQARAIDRLRDIPAALARDGEHFSAAVVSPQCGQRIHGPDLRSL